ncbi:DUF3592 domain-containing protein [Isoalcanivorax indicus]|uniref:DUF3592 domain-containing protein n=1 Tax=Isoalcanivorax indicus TaxID=2202653 RepID=UPI000DBA0636|nr:DUF3592 domain-containing protein [Isoalcanivorax indicus]
MKIITIAFTAVGVVLLAVAVGLGLNTQRFVAESHTATGQVVALDASRSSDGGTTWRPVVSFRAGDGQTYRFSSQVSSNPPAYKRGETVTVLYAPEQPDNARIKGLFSLWGGVLICALVGVMFTSVGGVAALAPLWARRRAAQLRQTGRRIETRFQGVEANTRLTVNGRHPQRIVTQWQNPATGEVQVFFSRNLWFDPSEHIRQHSITVWMDPQKPGRYVMDTDFLARS